jgi:hypothetical protein
VVTKSGHIARITSIIICCFMPLDLYTKEEKSARTEHSFMLARGHVTSHVTLPHDLPERDYIYQH